MRMYNLINRNFWRLLEMPLINYKVELSFSWDPSCVLSNLVRSLTFTTTDAKLYLPVVTLSTKDNAKLSNLLSEEFKKTVYWNKYKIIPNKKLLFILFLDASYQGIRDCLFLFIEIVVVLIKLQMILTEDTSFQE